MAEELSVNFVVNNVLDGMSDTLSDEQLKKLKDILYINLHDITLQKQIYDLALTTDNDAEKVRRFVVSEKVLDRASGTINQYIRSAWMLRTVIYIRVIRYEDNS